MKITAHSPTPLQPSMVVSLRCPFCRQQGTFDAIGGLDIGVENGRIIGYRRCPNRKCEALILFAWDAGPGNQLLVSYPAERIDFDSSQIPPRIVKSMEEAVACHATECYTAAAIMVRKTLELLCAEHGATGGNLKDRLTALASKIVLPTALMGALDDLRLLGNDAAHVESQVYNDVGREEVEAGIELAKEVLKATYQLEGLLAKLRALKRPSP